jgi:hypothetical protein
MNDHERQGDGEGGAVSESLARCDNDAAVQFSELPRDRQTEAEPRM